MQTAQDVQPLGRKGDALGLKRTLGPERREFRFRAYEQSRQPGAVIPGKTLVTIQRGFVHLHLMAQGLQPFDAALESRLVAHSARR